MSTPSRLIQAREIGHDQRAARRAGRALSTKPNAQAARRYYDRRVACDPLALAARAEAQRARRRALRLAAFVAKLDAAAL